MPDLATRWVTPWRASLAVALLPAVLAVAQLGRIHPDEVYQMLEPAFWRAHGYGILAWEWQKTQSAFTPGGATGGGIRNWALPLLFSWMLRGCEWAGITHPRAYRAVLEVPQYLLHAWMLLAVYRSAHRRVGERGGYLALLLVGLYGPVMVFAGRTMGESFSTALVVIGLEALDRVPGRFREGLWGGALLGLSVVTRYGSAVCVLGAMLWLLGARRWRVFGGAVLSGVAVAAALGALDWQTWGEPFHSFVAYTRFNVLSGAAAAHFGSAPATYYLPLLFAYAPIWIWPGLVWAVLRQRPRVPIALASAVPYFSALCWAGHKEARFLYPALVLLAVAAAPGVLGLLQGWRADLRTATASLLLFMSVGPFFLHEEGFEARASDQFRATIAATRGPGVRGLLIIGDGLWGTGGFFYIGKEIPWLTCDQASDGAFQFAMRDPRFNRVVAIYGHETPVLEASGFHRVGTVGDEVLFERE